MFFNPTYSMPVANPVLVHPFRPVVDPQPYPHLYENQMHKVRHSEFPRYNHPVNNHYDSYDYNRDYYKELKKLKSQMKREKELFNLTQDYYVEIQRLKRDLEEYQSKATSSCSCRTENPMIDADTGGATDMPRPPHDPIPENPVIEPIPSADTLTSQKRKGKQPFLRRSRSMLQQVISNFILPKQPQRPHSLDPQPSYQSSSPDTINQFKKRHSIWCFQTIQGWVAFDLDNQVKLDKFYSDLMNQDQVDHTLNSTTESILVLEKQTKLNGPLHVSLHLRKMWSPYGNGITDAVDIDCQLSISTKFTVVDTQNINLG